MRQDNGIRIRRSTRLLTLSLLIVLMGGVFASPSRGSAAPSRSTAPPGPDRYGVTIVDYTRYFWWMIRWGEDEVECYVEVDHEGLPTPGDIYVDCGEVVYDEWVTQEACTGFDVNRCKGFYLVLVDQQAAQKKISTKLQAPVVQVTLENCNPV